MWFFDRVLNTTICVHTYRGRNYCVRGVSRLDRRAGRKKSLVCLTDCLVSAFRQSTIEGFGFGEYDSTQGPLYLDSTCCLYVRVLACWEDVRQWHQADKHRKKRLITVISIISLRRKLYVYLWIGLTQFLLKQQRVFVGESLFHAADNVEWPRCQFRQTL